MAFRFNDNDLTRWFSERIGKVDRAVRPVTISGVDISFAYQKKKEPIIRMADLQALDVGESIAIYRGKTRRNQTTHYFEHWPLMARES